MSEQEEVEVQQEAIPEAQEAESHNEEVRSEASRLGWVDKDQFRGDPEDWVDAQSFVRRGREILPILKKNNEKLNGKVRELEQRLMEQSQTFGQFQEFHTRALEQQKQEALKQLRAARKQAIETSDGDAFDQVEEHIRSVEAYRPTQQPPQSQQNQQVPPGFVEWVADNPWYAKDREMASEADVLGQQIYAQGFRGSYRELLDEVSKKVRDAHPQKFRNTARSLPASVSEPSPAPRKSGKSWNDLPAEARDIGDRFVRTIPGYTREKYLANYQWS